MAEETADIYRMNKLLEIKNADWERQLRQAVSMPHGFSLPQLSRPVFMLTAIHLLFYFDRALRIPALVFSRRAVFSTVMNRGMG